MLIKWVIFCAFLIFKFGKAEGEFKDAGQHDEIDLPVLPKPVKLYTSTNPESLWFINQTIYMHYYWEVGPNQAVKWFKDGHEIEINDRLNYSSTIFVIHEITEDDAGEYECNASNKYGSNSFKTVVSVYNKPKITKNIENIVITPGATVIFPCQFEIDKRITNVTVGWIYEYEKIVYDDDHTIEDDNSLKISNVKESDAGTYYCQLERNEMILAYGENGELTVTTDMHKEIVQINE